MTTPELVLAYIQALIWPVVVGGVLFYLRQPLREKVEQLLKVGFGSASAEFMEKREQTFESALEALEETGSILAPSTEPEPAAEPPPVPMNVTTTDNAGLTDTALVELRPAKPTGPPTANQEPVPKPTRAQSVQPSPKSGYEPVVAARRLEDDVRRLTKQRLNPMNSILRNANWLDSAADEALLGTLRKRLRDLDPNSPYAN